MIDMTIRFSTLKLNQKLSYFNPWQFQKSSTYLPIQECVPKLLNDNSMLRRLSGTANLHIFRNKLSVFITCILLILRA